MSPRIIVGFGVCRWSRSASESRSTRWQIRTVVDLAETRRPADADDLDRPVSLDTGRPAPVMVHADHSYRAADRGLSVCQRSDRSLDAAVGRVKKFAEMCDS